MSMHRIIFFGETFSIHKTKGGHGIDNHVPILFPFSLKKVKKWIMPHFRLKIYFSLLFFFFFFLSFFVLWSSVSVMIDKARNKT